MNANSATDSHQEGGEKWTWQALDRTEKLCSGLLACGSVTKWPFDALAEFLPLRKLRDTEYGVQAYERACGCRSGKTTATIDLHAPHESCALFHAMGCASVAGPAFGLIMAISHR